MSWRPVSRLQHGGRLNELIRREQEKTTKYESAAAAMRSEFVPVIISAQGQLGPRAVDLCKRVAKHVGDLDPLHPNAPSASKATSALLARTLVVALLINSTWLFCGAERAINAGSNRQQRLGVSFAAVCSFCLS